MRRTQGTALRSTRCGSATPPPAAVTLAWQFVDRPLHVCRRDTRAREARPTLGVPMTHSTQCPHRGLKVLLLGSVLAVVAAGCGSESSPDAHSIVTTSPTGSTPNNTTSGDTSIKGNFPVNGH